MHKDEDSDIIQRVKSGDTDAFEILVRKYHKHLLNFIFRIIRDQYMVEDIGQEVFLNIFRSLAGFDESRGVPFSAWLFIVARNKCISELRKIKNRKFMPIIEDSFATKNQSQEEIIQKKEQILAIEKALENLDEPFRAVILESLKGKSVKEISRSCKIPDSTVKTRIFRAKAKLRHLLGGIND